MTRFRTLFFCVGSFWACLLSACWVARPDHTPVRPNVVVFLLDAGRADHFGCYGYDRNTTPNIDALAKSSVVFDSVISEAASTFPATSALMTGRSTRDTALWKTQRVPESFELLAQKAERAGYRTYAYSENPFVTSAFGFERGFSVFDEAFPHEEFRNRGGELPSFDSREHIARALEWIAQDSGEPFFAYFHILRPHNPYNPPASIASRFVADVRDMSDGATATLLAIDSGARIVSGAELERIVGLYDANLAYGDELFGELMSGLREQSLLDDSVIVVLSDHGEGFLEHGRMLHTSTVYDEMIRVPLIVRFPSSPGKRRVASPLQLHDVGRGIARLFEGEPVGRVPDAAVFEPATRRVADVSSERSSAAEASNPTGLAIGGAEAWTISRTLPRFGLAAVRSNEGKLLVEIGPEGCGAVPGSFFDLKVDPEEQTPLPALGRPEAASMLAAFAARETWACADAAIEEGAIDEVTRDRLRALGYAD